MKKQILFDLFGHTQTAVAEALDIKQPSVATWGEDIPDSALGRFVRMHPRLAVKVLRDQLRDEKK